MTSSAEIDRTAPQHGAHTKEQATAARVKELALGLCNSAMMMAVTKLGVADQIDDEPVMLAELAEAVGADAATLGRLLRALEVRGVFQEDGQDHFAHTDLSRLLREDHPNSVRWQVLWTVAPWTWTAWPHLDQAVRTGQPVFPDLYGKEFFAYLSEDAPESQAIFNRAMSQSSSYTSEAVADVVDLSAAACIVDIGGGQGHLLGTLLRRNPHVQGILYDLPSAVSRADSALRPGGELADRATVLPGSCLESVPGGCDVYILKNLLEWDDDRTVQTLHNIAVTAPAGARVLIVQNLVDSSAELAVTTAMDLLLLINVGGRKHPRRHLEHLIAQSGLELREIRPTRSSLFVLDARVRDRAG